MSDELTHLLRVILLGQLVALAAAADQPAEMLAWSEFPPLPNPNGVAGPFAGQHQGALIVAGGANFPAPVWETDKEWHDEIYVLVEQDGGLNWISGGRLERPIAYGAAVSTPGGIVCLGGNDTTQTYSDVFLLQWDPQQRAVASTSFPSLPTRCAYGAATLIDGKIYLAGGQEGSTLDTAMRSFWCLDLAFRNDPHRFVWQSLEPLPSSRAFNITVAQHNGFEDCVYVISGRRQSGTETEFLRDVWEYSPSSDRWRSRADVPRCVMAGPAAKLGQSHLLVLGGADGSLFANADALGDDHPGFPKSALAYHTLTDTWIDAGPLPQNHVTTIAVPWRDSIVIPSGEIRPRVRSPTVWQATPQPPRSRFGLIDNIVLVSYLAAMVLIGAICARRVKNTDDYFRGGQRLPWWAAGCSIFATMLSSLTFTGIPSKAYAQDWVYAIGNLMIPVVAIIAVFFALPFYRRIDATTAYEYLEQRFNRPVRLFGSASFTLFHVFRMGVVMSLTGLALAVATPLTPTQAVLVMGLLSLIYCTLGGIEAVVWTDTVQTIVLLGGAMLAIVLLIRGVDGGLSGCWDAAINADKLRLANWHWSPLQTQVALWVIIIGGLGQNISSYTADQAVVQRYMTTPTERLAARSIWLNAALAIPATGLFFAIGTGLFAFYRSHPEKLSATMTTDQIFPLFIANEMPIGLAGLLVAAIFAAAQSTVSTSMNSTASAMVTDWLRPLRVCRTERGYMWSARLATVALGTVGTALGIVFVDPEIKSLFDAFIKVIGLFMGVLGGLFVLGGLTRRANSGGAIVGALIGAGVMLWVWTADLVNGFLYTAVGLVTCVVAGYLASLILPSDHKDLSGLTLGSLRSSRNSSHH